MGICRFDAVNDDAFSYYVQLNRLHDFCCANFHQDINLQLAADICGLERTYFSTYFHLKVGVCFKCWLGLMRIEHAKKLINNSNQAITSIAYDSGFNSLSNFERTFKRSLGMTPGEYKKLVRPA